MYASWSKGFFATLLIAHAILRELSIITLRIGLIPYLNMV